MSAVRWLLPATLLAVMVVASVDSAQATKDQTGQWTPYYDWSGGSSGKYAIHLVLLRGDGNPYHSRILWWSNDMYGTVGGGEWGWKSVSQGCDSFPQASSFIAIPVPSSYENLFCSGTGMFGDGRMLSSGGSDSVTGSYGSNESRIWKDSTGTNSGYWINPGPMKQWRWYPTVTTLADGRMIVLAGDSHPHHRIFGGKRNGSVPTSPIGDSLYRFSPVMNGQWDPAVIPMADDSTGRRPAMREGHSAANMEFTGNIVSHVFFGGEDTLGIPRSELWFLFRQTNITGDDYIYKWQQKLRPNGPSDRSHHSAIVVPDTTGGGNGGMFVWGGRDNAGSALLDPKVYRLHGLGGPHWTAITPTGTAPSARFGHTAIYDGTYLNGDAITTHRMFVFGGVGADGQTPTDKGVWELRFTSSDLNSAAWSQPTVVSLASGSPPSPAPRFGQSMVWDYKDWTNSYTGKKGHVGFMFGGQLGSSTYSDTLWALWIFKDGTVGWEMRSVSGAAPGARARHTMVLDELQGPRLYLFGGDKGSTQADTSVWVIKPWAGSSPSWSQWAPPIQGFHLSGQSATLDVAETQARTPEVYNSASGWQDMLSSSNLVQHSYPPAFLIQGGSTSGGRVLSIAVNDSAYYLDVASLGSGNVWNKLTNGGLGFSPQSGVLYAPNKIMVAGGAGPDGVTGTTKTLDVSSLTNSWQTSGSMVPRSFTNLVLLPGGKVVAVGGEASTNSHDVQSPVRRPQIWDPATGAWTDTTLDRQPTMRNYHSTAILLPDGRVLSAGGDEQADKYRADIFCPPYLFDGSSLATRPTHALAPAGHMKWGRVFTVATSRASTIKSVCLIRSGATTHAFDMNQRYVPLSFVTATSPDRLLITAPADSTIAPPGDYLLFMVDSVSTSATRVPSIATWMRMDRYYGPDSADATSPDAISDLMGYCGEEGSHSYEFTVTWTSPADDGSLSASGPATAFDLRRSGSSITDGNFGSATQVSTDPPHVVGTSEQATLTLNKGSTYYFRIKTNDDNQNLSAISNQISISIPVNTFCEGGGMFAGSGGGEGSSMRRVTDRASLKSNSNANAAFTFVENSLFGGAKSDTKTTDVLRLVSPTVLGNGAIQVRLRTGGARHVAVDRVRLLVADHTAEGTACAVSDRVVLGTPTAASRILVGESTEIMLDGASEYPAAAGEVLTVDLGSNATESTPLLIEAASGTAAGMPDSSGILVQTPDGQGGWRTTKHIHPRQSMDAVALDGISGASLRLQILSPQTLRFVGRLAPAAETPAVEWTTVTSALGKQSADRSSSIASTDTLSATMAGTDTLILGFNPPALAEGKTRDYFLVVDATPLSTRGSVVTRSAPTGAGLPLAFAMRQNQPNPFSRTTSIRFELPVGAMVRMDVFDALGRRVKKLAGRFFPAGYHAIEWDHSSDDGQRMGPGVYFYRVEAGPFRDRKKMVLLP